METHIKNYTDRGFYTFTFEGLTAEINDKEKIVKKHTGFEIGNLSINISIWITNIYVIGGL